MKCLLILALVVIAAACGREDANWYREQVQKNIVYIHDVKTNIWYTSVIATGQLVPIPEDTVKKYYNRLVESQEQK